MKKLIIVHGAFGIGKSTLIEKILQDVDIKLIKKDTIKEFLFDYLGVFDQKWSSLLGRASNKMSLDLIGELFGEYDKIMFENLFWYDQSRKDIKEFIIKNQIDALEIFCYADADARKERYIKRVKSGESHSGHNNDLENIPDFEFENAQYQPIGLSEMAQIDLTSLLSDEYDKLLINIKNFLMEEK